MLMMRDFITDQRLHKALDEVEAWFGYEFTAAPMPLSHRERAKCTMHMHPRTNECQLLFIEDEPQSQACYCHELGHVVMWILGAPCTCYSKPIAFSDLLNYEPIYLSWNLLQHIPLWELTRDIGFDESEGYQQLLQNMIDMISQHRFYLDAPSELRTPFQSVALAFGLAAPSTQEIHVQIRTVAEERIPPALELADAILSDFEKLSLLSEQGFQAALIRLFDIIKPPITHLQLSFLDRIDPSFRSRILEAAKL